MQAVSDVFPDAEVSAHCIDKYPVRVRVEAKMGASRVKIWKGDQRNLFRKYAAQRTKSIKEIKEGLEMFKEEME
jgi:hypothetical protein